MTFPVEKHKENLADEIDELQISLFTENGGSQNPREVAQKTVNS
jgi:hypothetical protein